MEELKYIALVLFITVLVVYLVDSMVLDPRWRYIAHIVILIAMLIWFVAPAILKPPIQLR